MPSDSRNYFVVSNFEPSAALSGVGEKLGEIPTDIESGKITLRFGRRPYAVPLIPFAKARQRKISDKFQFLFQAYEPWAVFYAIGIQDTGDLRNVVRFGVKIRLVNHPTAAIASAFPETSY